MGTDIKAQQERMQIADLLRLAKHGDIQTGLKQRELQIEEDRLGQLTTFQKDSLGLRGRETIVAEKKVKLEEEASQGDMDYKKALKEGNIALADKYKEDVRRSKQISSIIDKYLAGSGSEAEKDIARHAMGLPVGSENTQRLKESAGVKLIEDIKAGKDDKEATAPLVQLYNEKYGADNSSTVYIWGGAPGVFGSIGLDDEYKPVELPVDSDLKRKLTLKDIRDGAKTLNISISQMIERVLRKR